MIYLDYNATTPIAPDVFEAMRPFLTTEWGNPSSAYGLGVTARNAVAKAREQVAQLVGAHPGEILFTSCATESNNAAIHAALMARAEKRHIITSAVEHSSVLQFCRFLEQDGYRITYLPVDREGLLDISDLEASIGDDTALVSLMWANNETGVLFPVEQIAGVCHEHGVLFHCDAVQMVGKMSVNAERTGADYLSLSGHKFHAPKGVGALYVHRKAPFCPYLHGGHQEQGRRGGTENVALVVGLGVAAELALTRVNDYEKLIRPLRDSLESDILGGVECAELNGHRTLRLPNTTNISFRGVSSDALVLVLEGEGVCVSSGSACLADSGEPSHVIKAMKPEIGDARQSLRLSLGYDSLREAVVIAASAIVASVKGLLEMRGA
ncbi:MAG: aminotransferase class V-fold PLP-dependent enzyme [Kiritimatiellae bacterium]|nr:aminotransferase class V-fold PLP-dependent enzyme [Kiritimatiellia bacterium]